MPPGEALDGAGHRRLVEVEKVERETGFEPATSTLARSHSTTELFPLAERLKYHTAPAPFKNAGHTTPAGAGHRRPPSRAGVQPPATGPTRDSGGSNSLRPRYTR